MEKPILFNTEMVKAILEDRKTCTRRIIKKKYSNTDIDFHENKYGKRLVEIQNDAPAPVKNPNGTTTYSLVACEEIKKPYKVGDILYVRETWCRLQELDDNENFIEGTERYYYRAGDWPDVDFYLKPDGSRLENISWKPSIHMPKEAARIFLRVTNVKAERLQDITEDQIKKEGIREEFPPLAQDAFQELWDSTTKEYRWRLNPWVWVIEFERVEKYEI